ncbi:MAG: cytochrome c oxidase subunit II [Actinobacteria bacterium]|nr:cytochrome c oxidase subunit II [Actinomycetota bacterium]
MRFAATPTLDTDGPVAEAMADLWWLMLALGALVFVLFLALLIRGLLRGAPEGVDDEEHHRRLTRRWIGLGGVALPAIVISVVFGATLRTMADVPSDTSVDALEVQVTGHQFWYEVRYPQHGIVTANEIHLPVGRQIEFRLTSADVIHSFWIPALGGKLDMLPERTNTLVLQADEPGVHTSRCAEFCGLQHALMGMVVVVEPADEFDAWVERHVSFTEPESPGAREGRGVFISAGCVECHAFRGGEQIRGDGPPGPDLTWLTERRTLGAATIPNTEQNLIDWITDPHVFKEGIEMPASTLTRTQLDALLAYLRADG